MTAPTLFDHLAATAGLGAAYLILALAVLRSRLPFVSQQTAFAALNMCACYLMFFRGTPNGPASFGALLGIAVVQLSVLHFTRGKADAVRIHWAAALLPIVFLVAIKTVSPFAIIGASYMAFRMTQAALELRALPELKIGVPQYLAFLFFPPTITAGPISPYSYYAETIDGSSFNRRNFTEGIFRIATGCIKAQFLAVMIQQITGNSLWTTSFENNFFDYAVGGMAYYLYLYLSFSGYSDVAVGAGAILGLKIKENFDRPLMATTIQDFWSRWHMSLTHFVRDTLFNPISMTLARWLGMRWMSVAVLGATVPLFLILALWHGTAPGYFIFYSLHALAFSLSFLWDQHKKKLGRDKYREYKNDPWTKAIGRISTFAFLSLTCPFLEFPQSAQIQNLVAMLHKF